MKRLVPLAAFLVFVSACNSLGTIGAACTVDRDCEYGQTCNSSGAGGFCTRGCTFAGERAQCPNGSTCATLGTGIGVGTAVLLCLPLCTDGATCRDGYECGAASGTIKACKPKPTM